MRYDTARLSAALGEFEFTPLSAGIRSYLIREPFAGQNRNSWNALTQPREDGMIPLLL